MSKLNLSVAIGDYDRNRPLIDGAVQIDGVDPVFMKLYPEEIFFRAFRSEEFDICECSLSSFSVKTASGNCPYVGVPAFVSRMFRHTAMFCRTDRIKRPEDLNAPGWRLHRLTGELRDHWSIRVSVNWRLTFAFEGEDRVRTDQH